MNDPELTEDFVCNTENMKRALASSNDTAKICNPGCLDSDLIKPVGVSDLVTLEHSSAHAYIEMDIGKREKQQDNCFVTSIATPDGNITPQLIARAMYRTFERLNNHMIKQLLKENDVRALVSGATFVVVIVYQNYLITASVGDSAAFIINENIDQPGNVQRLSPTHELSNEKEHKRVIDSGDPKFTKIVRGRLVCGEANIAMTRAFVDLNFHKVGLIAVPTITLFELPKEGSSHVFVCSDGLTEDSLASNAHISRMISVVKMLEPAQVPKALIKLNELCGDNQAVCYLTNLDGVNNNLLVAGVSDGHGFFGEMVSCCLTGYFEMGFSVQLENILTNTKDIPDESVGLTTEQCMKSLKINFLKMKHCKRAEQELNAILDSIGNADVSLECLASYICLYLEFNWWNDLYWTLSVAASVEDLDTIFFDMQDRYFSKPQDKRILADNLQAFAKQAKVTIYSYPNPHYTNDLKVNASSGVLDISDHRHEKYEKLLEGWFVLPSIWGPLENILYKQTDKDLLKYSPERFRLVVDDFVKKLRINNPNIQLDSATLFMMCAEVINGKAEIQHDEAIELLKKITEMVSSSPESAKDSAVLDTVVKWIWQKEEIAESEKESIRSFCDNHQINVRF